jgi:hypothetical protein
MGRQTSNRQTAVLFYRPVAGTSQPGHTSSMPPNTALDTFISLMQETGPTKPSGKANFCPPWLHSHLPFCRIFLKIENQYMSTLPVTTLQPISQPHPLSTCYLACIWLYTLRYPTIRFRPSLPDSWVVIRQSRRKAAGHLATRTKRSRPSTPATYPKTQS